MDPVAAIGSRQAAVAVAADTRRSDDAGSLILRAHALAMLDPEGSAEVTRRLGPEAGALLALHGLAKPPDGHEPLAAAARVRHAPDDQLAGALAEARRTCTGALPEAWLRVAVRGRGLEQRTAGQLPAVLDPAHMYVAVPGATLDMGRAHRRFAVLWALATAPELLAREALFAHVWGRPWLGDDDATSLQATVSRTRSLLPEGVGIAGLPGGGYALDPDWAVFVPPDAPPGGVPLAPLGRDAEAAAARRALREAGAVVLRGPSGSGTSHLARALAAAWPAGCVFADLRAGPAARVVPALLGVGGADVGRVLDERLLVLDHADDLQALPWTASAVLLARTRPMPGLPEVTLGPLTPREAASLAKATGVPDPPGAAFPLALRLGARPLDGVRPSAQRLLARLLTVPGGAPTGLARRLGGADVLATLDDLEVLQQRNLVRRRGDRLVAEDALRLEVDPQPLPDVVSAWETHAQPRPPEALAARVDGASAEPDLDRANIALRHAVAACGDHPALRCRALLALAAVAARSGRPDAAVERELSELAPEPLLAAQRQRHLGVRALWQGDPLRAWRQLRTAARQARHLGAWDLAQAALADVGEACLRLGLHEACARALGRSAELGRACAEQRRAIRAAMALDLGQRTRAAELLGAAPGPAVWQLRRGQLDALEGRDPAGHYRAAIAGFEASDRRWVPVALAMLAHTQPEDAPELLSQARAAMAPDDAGSAAAVTLVEASLNGNLPAALSAVRASGHADATTFPWDLVRFLVALATRA